MCRNSSRVIIGGSATRRSHGSQTPCSQASQTGGHDERDELVPRVERRSLRNAKAARLRRGFRTAIYERAFDATFLRQSAEPAVALCGIDNALGRQALDNAGFSLVVEAGLGRGHSDFRTMRLHTLPGSRRSAEMWKITRAREDLTNQPAYQRLLADGALDRCGVTLLAGKAVGAPFVGAVAATMVVSQVLRQLHGAPLDQVVDLDLQSVDHRLVAAQQRDFSSLNPGYLRVR